MAMILHYIAIISALKLHPGCGADIRLNNLSLLHFLFPCSGACDQIPGATLQRGYDPQRDERSGEEEHSQDPRLKHHAGLLMN